MNVTGLELTALQGIQRGGGGRQVRKWPRVVRLWCQLLCFVVLGVLRHPETLPLESHHLAKTKAPVQYCRMYPANCLWSPLVFVNPMRTESLGLDPPVSVTVSVLKGRVKLCQFLGLQPAHQACCLARDILLGRPAGPWVGRNGGKFPKNPRRAGPPMGTGSCASSLSHPLFFQWVNRLRRGRTSMESPWLCHSANLTTTHIP